MAQKQKRLRFDNAGFVHGKQPRRQVLRPGEYILGVGAPLDRRDLVVEVGERPDELEGEELLLEARRAPYLEELAGGDGDAGPAGAEGHGFHGVLEGDPVEYHLPVEIHEEAPPVSIDDQEEHAVRGGRQAADVRGGLHREG